MPRPPAKLKVLENSLHRVYLKIFREIKKEPDYPDNLPAIQRKYNKLVYDNTRSAVQQSVILANEKVNRVFKTEPYITQSDLDLIKKNTDEQVGSFWRKIMLDIFRKQEQRLTGGASASYPSSSTAIEDDTGDIASLEPPDDLGNSDINMTAYLLAVSIASLFASFSDATLSKTDELSDTVVEKPKVKWVTMLREKTCHQLPDGSEGCSQRNGRIYDYDDAELQQHLPITGTHPNCNCFLETII